MKTENYAIQLIEWLKEHGTKEDDGFFFGIFNDMGEEITAFWSPKERELIVGFWDDEGNGDPSAVARIPKEQIGLCTYADAHQTICGDTDRVMKLIKRVFEELQGELEEGWGLLRDTPTQGSENEQIQNTSRRYSNQFLSQRLR